MSRITPTVTPEIFTGFPSARPVTVSSFTLYSFLREKIFCSDPMKKRKTMSTTAADATSSPTRIVFSCDWGAMFQSVTDFLRSNISGLCRLSRDDRARPEKLLENRMLRVARRVHRSHPLEHSVVEKRDSVPYGER